MDEACSKCGADDGIAGKCAAMFVAQNAEIASLRAELSKAREVLFEMDKIVAGHVAAARQDAEERATDIEAAEKRGYDCGVNDIIHQDTKEIARLKEALEIET